MLLAVPFGLLIGLVVGTVGGGGAILALPVLVYVLGEGVGPATTASLIVIALAAAIGAGARTNDRQVCWRIALAFAAPAAAGSLMGTLGNNLVEPRVLILTFVPVMLIAAGATWRRASSGNDDARADCPPTALERTTLAGLGVGGLTGFFGVGGGFLIMPVLTIWLGVQLRQAVGTSLVVITLTAIAALGSHLLAGAHLNLPITATLAAAASAGALAGTAAGRHMPQRTLGQAFALVVVAVAIFLLIDTLLLGGPPTA